MRISSRHPGWVARTSRYWRIIGVSSAGTPAILASFRPDRGRPPPHHRRAAITTADAAGGLRADGVHAAARRSVQQTDVVDDHQRCLVAAPGLGRVGLLDLADHPDVVPVEFGELQRRTRLDLEVGLHLAVLVLDDVAGAELGIGLLLDDADDRIAEGG